MRVKDFYHDEIASNLNGHDAYDHFIAEPDYRAYHIAKELLQLQKDVGVVAAIDLFARNLQQLQGTTNPAVVLSARKAA